ncbi:hypothetical protein HWC14_gp46 [Serratia phage Parlo]|uniref:Uncharacterized protein n=1 Tax=Serratia phage Parlo TaxID=2557554 RepID=A0A482MFK3_9CAUD|nr:hypothetical protein HWC14_gp46 [Serratia phage Parlo]QBQ72195.1 hypothetical protein CPT_Parlo_046 [Serratia phage Parlo]
MKTDNLPGELRGLAGWPNMGYRQREMLNDAASHIEARVDHSCILQEIGEILKAPGGCLHSELPELLRQRLGEHRRQYDD